MGKALRELQGGFKHVGGRYQHQSNHTTPCRASAKSRLSINVEGSALHNLIRSPSW